MKPRSVLNPHRTIFNIIDQKNFYSTRSRVRLYKQIGHKSIQNGKYVILRICNICKILIMRILRFTTHTTNIQHSQLENHVYKHFVRVHITTHIAANFDVSSSESITVLLLMSELLQLT